MPSRRKHDKAPAETDVKKRDNAGYGELLESLKTRIRAAQVSAVLAVNREMIELYWDIGRTINERQAREGWGSFVIDRLAKDLRASFPDVQGFSSRNLWRMRAFYLAYSEEIANLPQAVAELGEIGNLPERVARIPWGHNIVLLEKVKVPAERLWYAEKTVEYGWSRNVLVHQIESGLHLRQGKAITNFDRTLVAPQSDLAAQLLKDPYHFDFLQMAPAARERDMERALIAHIRDFLLELGVGFALVGTQYGLEVGGQDFRIDLLFYHFRLHCFVVVELKVGAFQPEHAGKMNFYLSAVDAQLRGPGDQPTIGIILCKGKNRVVAEYALSGSSRPISVAEYRVPESLPTQLRGSLPTPEELENELNNAVSDEAGNTVLLLAASD